MKKPILFLSLLLALFACNNTPKPEQETTSQEPNAPVTVSQAIQLLTDSIAMDSTNAKLYLSRAKAYFANEQIGQTMVDINHSLSLDPKNVDTYLLLADVYYTLGDEANIGSTLNRAVEVDPLDPRPCVKLAELNLLQQNYNLAIGYVDKSLGLSSYNPRAYFVRGMTYLAKQDTVSAMKNFMISREQDASFYDPQREICAIYRVQDNPLTESFMRSMMSNFPERPIVRYDLALFLQENGNPEEALAHYDTLLMLQPSNSRLLFNKGYVYFVYLGDNEKALSYFNQSLESDPSYVDALYNKGHVYEQMGNYAQAKMIYKQVLSAYPDYQLAIDGMNRVSGN